MERISAGSSQPDRVACSVSSALDSDSEVSRGRRPRRTVCLDGYERTSNPTSASSLAPAPSWAPSPPRVRFASEPQRRDLPLTQRRRHFSEALSADEILSEWRRVRERVGDVLRSPEPDERACHATHGSHWVAHELDAVTAFVEQCARQVSAARKRARMSFKQLQGLTEYAAHLHATHGLADEERRYDDSNPQSMAAALRTLLASIDSSRMLEQRTRWPVSDESHEERPTELPELCISDGEESGGEWVTVSTPPDRTPPPSR